MLTVSVFINGNPIFTRTVVNRGEKPNGKSIYLSDDGKAILHDPKEGAVKLAIKALETIKEVT